MKIFDANKLAFLAKLPSFDISLQISNETECCIRNDLVFLVLDISFDL